MTISKIIFLLIIPALLASVSHAGAQPLPARNPDIQLLCFFERTPLAPVRFYVWLAESNCGRRLINDPIKPYSCEIAENTIFFKYETGRETIDRKTWTVEAVFPPSPISLGACTMER